MLIKSDWQLLQTGRGKSGGARVISVVKVLAETVVLLSIYSKGEKNSISDREIQKLLKESE